MRRLLPHRLSPRCGAVLATLLLLPVLARATANDELLLGKPVVGRNADGHLEVFTVDAQGVLRHRWQKLANGDWSSWNELGNSCAPGIALANSTNGELLVFVVDKQDHTLKYIQQQGPNSLDWSAWTNLGGTVRGPLTVGQNPDGRLEVFAVDQASHSVKSICEATTPNGWSGWCDLGGQVEPGLVVERNLDGRLELFAIDANTKGLLHCAQDHANASDNWSGWLSLGGSVSQGFAVRGNVLGRLEAFAVNRTNGLLQRICQQAPGCTQHWTGWMDFGLRAQPHLAVGKSADGRLEVLAVAAGDSTLMHRWEMLANGFDWWSEWASLGATAQPCPAVVTDESGDLEVFAVDLHDSSVLNHRRQISRSADWLDWAPLEHPTFQYSSRTWQTDEGLPHNTVQALAQTRDGYLWVGTRAGLARFDGLVFTAFETASAPELKNTSITALCADRSGALWIGTRHNGLYRLSNGKCAHFGSTNGLAGNTINAIYERQNGSLWIATATGLSRFKEEQFTTYTRQQGLSSDVIRSLYEDRDGDLWIATGEGLNRLREGNMDYFPMPDGLPNDSVRCICQDHGGRVWVGSNNGMLWHSPFYWGYFFAYNARYGLSDPFVSAICEDREGNLWVGTYSGLNRFQEGRFLTELDNEGVPFDRVNALFEDRESNLWVGTREGLVRLTPKRFTTQTRRQGLTHNNITSVLEDRAGNLWLGTWGGGLNRLKDDRVTAFATTNLSQTLVLALAEGHDGSLWVGADFDGGLTRIKDGVFTHYTRKDGLPPAPLHVLHEDQAGRLWLGSSRGLVRFQAGTFTNYALPRQLSNEAVRAICEDHEGNLWFGTDGGLARCSHAEVTTFTVRDGLSDNTILALYEDKEHTLWIGTATGGLNRMSLADQPPPNNAPEHGTGNTQYPIAFRRHASRITFYTTRQGLFSNEIFQILEDDLGWLWMSCSKGVFRVKKRDFNSLDQGNRETLVSLVYGKSDGMESPQCNGNGRPAGWKTRDGHLCFVTSKGLVTVDPNTVPINLAPPAVRIEQLLADNHPVRATNGLAADSLLWTADSGLPVFILPPGRGELEFHFTALTYQSPESTRFKYKLEGVDTDWVDAGTRRAAHYNNVNPGTYHFRVLACNKDGAWNERGAEVAFVLQPHLWQTWWWRAAVALAVVGTASGTARYLTKRRMQRKLALLEQRHAIEKERGRIAKDIHDDLGSSLTRIMMLGERAEEDLNAQANITGHITKIVGTARHTVRALDEIVWAVNPENDTLEGLVQYISHYADELFENSSVSCRLEMPAELPALTLSAEVRHDLFLVVKEAFHNVLKHSKASQVHVHLAVTASTLELSVEDNGCGFTPGQTSTGRKRNGLSNMAKRIKGLGGHLEFTTAPGQGTTVKLTVRLAPAP